jgi:FkbM family methyltransferase
MHSRSLFVYKLIGFSLMIANFSTVFGVNQPEVVFQVNAHPLEAIPYFYDYLPENPVIIDAGAFDGKEGAALARRWPKGHVHSFEPIPEIFANLSITASTTPNMSIYNFALNTEDSFCEMFVSELSNQPGVPFQSASLRSPKEHLSYAPHVLFPRSINVETFKIDTWAKLNNISRVDMMWLDMQGVELEVLKASPEIFATTQVIIMEVEFVEAYEGQYQYGEIKTWMEEQGFTLIWANFNPNCPNQNGQWFGDALFVRKG